MCDACFVINCLVILFFVILFLIDATIVTVSSGRNSISLKKWPCDSQLMAILLVSN